MQWLDRPRRALAVTLCATLLRLPVGLAVGRLVPGMAEDPAAYYAALMLQEILLWGLPALLMRPWRGVAEKNPSAGLCFAALPLGLAAQAALTCVTTRWTELTGAPQAAVLLPQNEVQWLLALLALAVVPALAEEAFFRGGLLTALRDAWGPRAALVWSTAVFALMHGSLAGLPAHVGIGALCGLCMLNCGRLWPSFLLHMGYNAAALVLRDVPVNLLPGLPLGVLLAACALYLVADVRWRRTGRCRGTDAALLAATLCCAAAAYLPQML